MCYTCLDHPDMLLYTFQCEHSIIDYMDHPSALRSACLIRPDQLLHHHQGCPCKDDQLISTYPVHLCIHSFIVADVRVKRMWGQFTPVWDAVAHAARNAIDKGFLNELAGEPSW